MIKQLISSALKRISLNLGNWNQDTRIVKLGPKEFGVDIPKNANTLPDKLIALFNSKAYLDQMSIYELRNVILSQNGIVFKNFRIFEPSLAEPWVKYTLNYSFLLKQFQRVSPISAKNEIALIYDQWSIVNYFHWMADTLPRLILLRDNYHPVPLLAPKALPSYAKITAAALGFTDWVSFDSDIVKVDRLVFPERTSPKGYQNPELMKQVVHDILKHLGYTHPKNPHRRLYISRYKNSSRRLSNENEIDSVLMKYGFEKIFFEDYSFEQQVKLISETSTLLGVHGANMTNLIFMQEGCTVIEIMNDAIFNSIYPSLSTCFQLSYFLIPATGAPVNSNSSDLSINPIELEKILSNL